MNLILLDASEVAPDGIALLRDARARHIRTVLRTDVGRDVRVGIIDGPVGSATVLESANDVVTLRCRLETDIPARPALDVLLALPRPKVLKRLWAQMAALGVGRIMLTNAARVERYYFDTHVLEPQIYRPLLVEGLQQARDTRLPQVSVHRRFTALIEDEVAGLEDVRKIYGDPGAYLSVQRALGESPVARALVAVGPEGGWTDHERHLLDASGCVPVTMGSRSLRSDTACIALLALAAAALPEGRRADRISVEASRARRSAVSSSR